MLDGYKIRDQYRPHYVTFTVTDWVDVFSRKIYEDILIENLKFCQKEKGLIIFGFCIMSIMYMLYCNQAKENYLKQLENIKVIVLKQF